MVLGVIPYRISFCKINYQQNIQIQAVFWCLTVNQFDEGQINWRLTLPFVRRLVLVIWTALNDLVKK
jgi:hypothetical protein